MLVTVPSAAGILCLVMPDKLKSVSRLASLFVSAAALWGSIYVFMNKPMFWQNSSAKILIADNLSAFIAIGIAAFALLITIYSFGFINKSFGRYFGCILITLGSAFGVVFANDFMTLMICWGVLGLTLFLLVNMDATENSARTAKKTFIIIGGTDALMLFGVTVIWAVSGTFYMDNIRLEFKSAYQFIAYLSVLAAALAKAGAMPLHSWLPDVAEDSPVPVTAYLPASLDKLLGIYLLARLSLNLFVMNAVSNTILSVIGSATIVLAVIFALVQHDLKRLLGYHAVSQVGYMVLGIGTGNPIGIAGGLFHMLNHAIYKSCLFLCGGNVEKGAGTSDLEKLGGLARPMPWTFAAFLVASLSISGIPPFNGFFSKWMIYQGIIESAGRKNPLWILWLVCAMFGSALTVASFMKLIHAVFLGRPSKGCELSREANFYGLFPVVILAILCFVFGVFAFQLPLPLFILPSVGLPVFYLGTWHPIVAAALIIAGLCTGLFAYFALNGKARSSPVFIGGEDPDVLERISGVDFYDTIKETTLFGGLYREESKGRFDIYEVLQGPCNSLTRFLRLLHNGVLPTYLAWCLIGMLALFSALLFLR